MGYFETQYATYFGEANEVGMHTYIDPALVKFGIGSHRRNLRQIKFDRNNNLSLFSDKRQPRECTRQIKPCTDPQKSDINY